MRGEVCGLYVNNVGDWRVDWNVGDPEQRRVG